ncbi:Uncharacterised protein [Vibrio cholerae]|nr:Uncharacterised protein [Vibrio cholerae]
MVILNMKITITVPLCDGEKPFCHCNCSGI